MMYYLWMLHYSMAKKIYKKRIKGLKKGAWGLAFLCIVISILFLLTLLSNKAILGDIMGSGLTLAPIGGLIAAIILIPLFFLSNGLTSKKISTSRKVIVQTRKIKRIHSILYVSFFVIVYISTIIIWKSSIHYHRIHPTNPVLP